MYCKPAFRRFLDALGDTPHAYYSLKATREHTLYRYHLTWIQFLQARNVISTEIYLSMPLLALCLRRTPYELTHTLTWSKAAMSLQLPKCCPRVTSTLPHPSVDQHKSTAEQIEPFVAVPQDRIWLRQLSQLSSRANQLISVPKQRNEQVRTNKKQYYLIHHKATKDIIRALGCSHAGTSESTICTVPASGVGHIAYIVHTNSLYFTSQ